MTNRVLIVGGDSFIGKALYEGFLKRGIRALKTTRRKENVDDTTLYLDLLDNVFSWGIPQEVSTVVVCAAVSRIQDCFKNPKMSYRVNVAGILELAKKAMRNDCQIIYLSTNQVFDGTKPYRKAHDETCPKTVYGKLKAKCEDELKKTCSSNLCIIRLAKVVNSGLLLFKSWKENLIQNKSITAFDDMFIAPVLLNDVTDALIRCYAQKNLDIYQLSGSRDVSYYAFAKSIAKHLEKSEILVKRAKVEQSGLVDEIQPRHTTFDCTESKEVLKFSQKDPTSIVKYV